MLAAHNTSIPSTTSQLLLQAAHSTSLVGGGAAGAFNPSSFLTSPSVNYENVFSPLFQHATPKPAHFNALNAQRLAQAALNKQVADADNFSQHHQQLVAAGTGGGTYFDQAAGSVAAAAALAWQNNNQLPSPFGILPHENTVSSSPGPTSSSTKSSVTSTASSSTYDGFNANFSTSDHGPQNNAINKSGASNQRDTSPSQHQQHQQSSNKQSSSQSSSYYPNSTNYGTTSDANMHANYAGLNKLSAQQQQQQQYNVGNKTFPLTSTSSAGTLAVQQIGGQQSAALTPSTSTKDYRSTVNLSPSSLNNSRINTTSAPSQYNNASTVVIKSEPCQRSPSSERVPPGFIPPPDKTLHAQHIQTKAQTKIYPALGAQQSDRRTGNNAGINEQSSPISFSMDSGRLNYAGNGSSAKVPQQYQNQPHSASTTYRHHYLGSDNNVGEFQNSSRTKSNSSATDAQQFPSNLSQQQVDCGVAVVPRRPSPLQANSQASPLGHAPSPAYPMYNSPMSSIASPQDQNHQQQQQQQHAANQINNYKLNAPKSPNDGRSSTQHNIAYSSVIQRATDRQSIHAQPQQPCWENEQAAQQQQQLQQQARKFQANMYANNQSQSVAMHQGSPHNQQLVSGQHQQINRNFDATPNNTTTLQDLSNCRQSEQIKNQQVPSAPPVPAAAPIPSKPAAKVTGSRKRKAIEKPITKNVNAALNVPVLSIPSTGASASQANVYANRVPPPAHVTQSPQSTTNSTNSTHLDYERWNLPPPPTQPSKVFAASSTGPNAHQSPAFNSSTNQTNHLQHNSINANTKHNLSSPFPNQNAPLPPSAYFPSSFQMPSSNDFVELSTVASSASTTATSVAMNHQLSYNPASALSNMSNPFNQLPLINSIQHVDTRTNAATTVPPQQMPREDEHHPKVFVPNIEDELGFLSETNRSNAQQVLTNQQHQPFHQVGSNQNNTGNNVASVPTSVSNSADRFNIKPTGPTAGFMSSYLKFLQGDRDTSPPPVVHRNVRKNTSNWSRSTGNNNNSNGSNNPTATVPDANASGNQSQVSR